MRTRFNRNSRLCVARCAVSAVIIAKAHALHARRVRCALRRKFYLYLNMLIWLINRSGCTCTHIEIFQRGYWPGLNIIMGIMYMIHSCDTRTYLYYPHVFGLAEAKRAYVNTFVILYQQRCCTLLLCCCLRVCVGVERCMVSLFAYLRACRRFRIPGILFLPPRG